MSAPRTLAITAGDPCGVGPEVVLKALAAPPVSSNARLVVIGDLAVFKKAARRLRRHLPSWTVLRASSPPVETVSSLTFLDCGHPHAFRPGHPSTAAAGAASLAYLDCAIALWRTGRLHALVTAPVTKWAIGLVKPSFVGQTEYLAHAMGRREVVMMFVSDRLRVALLTRHIPLSRVPRAISRRLLVTTLRLTAHGLTAHFKIPRPRLALCGLNPHAGEEARCGNEERAIMRPALRRLRKEGIVCDGPFAADGFFARPDTCLPPQRGRQGYDAVVCGYHDQGLIPFKMAARDTGCQLTLGLPIIRTSPDHGSALDIAGKGLAHPGSMRYALALAAKLVSR